MYTDTCLLVTLEGTQALLIYCTCKFRLCKFSFDFYLVNWACNKRSLHCHQWWLPLRQHITVTACMASRQMCITVSYLVGLASGKKEGDYVSNRARCRCRYGGSQATRDAEGFTETAKSGLRSRATALAARVQASPKTGEPAVPVCCKWAGWCVHTFRYKSSTPP